MLKAILLNVQKNTQETETFINVNSFDFYKLHKLVIYKILILC